MVEYLDIIKSTSNSHTPISINNNKSDIYYQGTISEEFIRRMCDSIGEDDSIFFPTEGLSENEITFLAELLRDHGYPLFARYRAALTEDFYTKRRYLAKNMGLTEEGLICTAEVACLCYLESILSVWERGNIILVDIRWFISSAAANPIRLKPSYLSVAISKE